MQANGGTLFTSRSGFSGERGNIHACTMYNIYIYICVQTAEVPALNCTINAHATQSTYQVFFCEDTEQIIVQL